jgi:hypothetical protein
MSRPALPAPYGWAKSFKRYWKVTRCPEPYLHDLGRLYRTHEQKGETKLKPMWTPRLYYSLARRLSPEVREAISHDLLEAMSHRTILIPVSYASLITRKE